MIVRVIVDGVLGVTVDVHIGHDEVLVSVVIYVAIFVVIFCNWRCTLYTLRNFCFLSPISRRVHHRSHLKPTWSYRFSRTNQSVPPSRRLLCFVLTFRDYICIHSGPSLSSNSSGSLSRRHLLLVFQENFQPYHSSTCAALMC